MLPLGFINTQSLYLSVVYSVLSIAKSREVDNSLTGLPLRIYLYLLSSGEPRTIREIASGIGASPSSVHYHVKKLVEAGILERSSNGYYIARRISIKGYIYIGSRLVPRLFVYSLFFLGIVIGELLKIALTMTISYDAVVAIASSATASVLLLIEGLEAWRRLMED